MPKRIKLLIVAIASTIYSFFRYSLPTFADSICSNANISAEAKKASGCRSGTDDQFATVIQNILYTIIGVLGIVAVIYVVIGGIGYMTSAGDAGKAQKARQTILYAVIGLVVCALAFAIVNFVIEKVLK